MSFPCTSTSWVAQKCGMTQDMRFSSRDRHLNSNINMWARCPSSHSYLIVSGSQRAGGQPQELYKHKHLISWDTHKYHGRLHCPFRRIQVSQYSELWASGVWPWVLFNFCEIFSLFFWKLYFGVLWGLLYYHLHCSDDHSICYLQNLAFSTEKLPVYLKIKLHKFHRSWGGEQEAEREQWNMF